MKKIIWGQLAKLITFFFNFTIGKQGLKSIFSQLLSIVDDSPSNQINEAMTKCHICKDLMTMTTFVDGCEHSFCYYCITSHKTHSDLCPVCYMTLGNLKTVLNVLNKNNK